MVHGKLLQSCPALCDLMDGSPPGSSGKGISQVRVLDGLPFPATEDIPAQGLNPCLLHLLHWQAGSLPLRPRGAHTRST